MILANRNKATAGGDDNMNQYIVKELEKIDEGKGHNLILVTSARAGTTKPKYNLDCVRMNYM